MCFSMVSVADLLFRLPSFRLKMKLKVIFEPFQNEPNTNQTHPDASNSTDLFVKVQTFTELAAMLMGLVELAAGAAERSR